MKSPGIQVRPIVNMAGYHEFNEVFFEDVRIPVRAIAWAKRTTAGTSP
ncbi:MAG: hypothetical protein IPH65_16195 [Dehalococcoidia bacterium]|nr:hypothetical protein [Dehalococcoidia bacterium]